jgi:DNA-binding MurR/RpiR family transcriptional regulator
MSHDASGTAPAGFDELRALISARYPTLSGRLKQIAQYALAHPNDLALETVAVVAERAGVQPSALIRFAQALGYEGFSDMQRVFRARLVERSPTYAERLREQAGEMRRPAEVLGHFVSAGHKALDHLLESVDPQTLERAVTLLAGADIVHLAGQRRAFGTVAYLAYGLGHLGRRTVLIDGLGGMLAHQARNITARDTLLAVSFTPYSEETQNVIRAAKEAQASVVVITDGALSPLVKYGDAVLFVEDAEVRQFRALTASMCLAVALVVALGQRMVEGEGRRERDVDGTFIS